MEAQAAGERARQPEDEAVDDQAQAAEGAEVRHEGDELEQQPQGRVQRAEDHRHPQQLQEGPAVDARDDIGRHQEAKGGKEEAEEDMQWGFSSMFRD